MKTQNILTQLFIYTCIFCVAIVTAAIINVGQVFASPVITEVFANPSTERDAGEWLEITNESEKPVVLNEWKYLGTSLPNLQLEAYEYAVITKDKDAFLTLYPNYQGKIIALATFSLTNTGKILTVERGGVVSDSVTYPSLATDESWQRHGPACNSGDKSSESDPGEMNFLSKTSCFAITETIGIEFSNDEQDWAKTMIGTPGRQIYARVTNPTLNDEVIWEQNDGKVIEIPFSFAEFLQTFVYASVKEDGQTFRYRSGTLNILPELKISEVLANPKGEDRDKEWIEVRNPNKVEIDISKIQVTVSDLPAEILEISESSSKEYFVIKVKGEILDNCNQPSTCKNIIGLKYDSVTIDSVDIVDTIEGLSSCQLADEAWTIKGNPTANAANSEYQKLSSVMLTEVYASPGGAEAEWVEIYNAGEQVELVGWHLQDISASQSISLTLKKSEHKIINIIDLALNNSGEELTLVDAVGNEISKVNFPALKTQQSYAREYKSSKYTDKWAISSPSPGKPTILPVTQDAASASSSEIKQAPSPISQSLSTIKLVKPLAGIQKLSEQQFEEEFKLEPLSTDLGVGLRISAGASLGILLFMQWRKELIALLQRTWSWWNT